MSFKGFEDVAGRRSEEEKEDVKDGVGNEMGSDVEVEGDDSDDDLEIASEHYFLLGTSSLKESNEIHVVVYEEESQDIHCQQVYKHPEEVWQLAPCPADKTLFCSVHGTGNNSHERRSTVWRLPPNNHGSSDSSEAMALEKVCDVPSSDFKIQCVTWESHGYESSALTRCTVASETEITVCDLDNSGLSVSATIGSEGTGVSDVAWDPHHKDEITGIRSKHIVGFDVRQTAPTYRIDEAHSLRVRDVDYNPNKPYSIVTCGDDCLVKFWDLRHAGKPILTLRGHSHWVCTAKFNPFHDQLILSAGSDACVDLWRVSSISSAPLLDLEEDDELVDHTISGNGDAGESAPSQRYRESRRASDDSSDALVSKFEEHEESVYAVAWSASEAWTFASLSYDGRMVVNHVPSTEKYKILL